VFASSHGYYVQPDDGAIHHSVVSLIPAGVRVTSRILRSTGRRGHPPQRYIPHSSSCFCDQQEITSLQTTVACSYSKCVALSVMRTIGWDVKGIHVSTIRNLIRREGSEYGIATIQITSNLSNICPSMWFQISAFAISHPGQRRVPPLVMK